MPTASERAVVERLLSRDFPGRDELAAQLQSATVSRIDSDGSLQFRVTGPLAPTRGRIPTEGRYLDSGSVEETDPAVNILLHVVNGELHELEIYKDDGSEITLGPYAVDPAGIAIW